MYYFPQHDVTARDLPGLPILQSSCTVRISFASLVISYLRTTPQNQLLTRELSNGSTVPHPHVCVLAPMLNSCEIAHMTGTINGVPRPASEGVWVPGGGIEITCKHQ